MRALYESSILLSVVSYFLPLVLPLVCYRRAPGRDMICSPRLSPRCANTTCHPGLEYWATTVDRMGSEAERRFRSSPPNGSGGEDNWCHQICHTHILLYLYTRPGNGALLAWDHLMGFGSRKRRRVAILVLRILASPRQSATQALSEAENTDYSGS